MSGAGFCDDGCCAAVWAAAKKNTPKTRPGLVLIKANVFKFRAGHRHRFRGPVV